MSSTSKQADAERLLAELLQRMQLEVTVASREDPERIVLEIVGAEAGLAIGKRGQTLDALQFMINRMVNRDAEGRKPILVDAEGYRTRREESLIELAHRLGEKARRTNRTVAMSPMSPHDRRIVHLTLDKVAGVTTRSEGEGAFRRLLIIPAPEKQV
jgi:spoIIIJ-associated protein